jgi:hypothetical protein
MPLAAKPGFGAAITEKDPFFSLIFTGGSAIIKIRSQQSKFKIGDL